MFPFEQQNDSLERKITDLLLKRKRILFLRIIKKNNVEIVNLKKCLSLRHIPS